MMSLSARDKQYIDDNMLTDEDFDFGTIEELQASYDENIFESFSNDLQITNNEALQSAFPQLKEQSSKVYAKNLLNDFFSKICDSDLKEEPPSPNSSEIYSSDKEVSVITIPEVSDNFESAILADTPPHTPCGLMDSLPASPISCSGDSLIVSVNSVSGVPYAIPQSTQAVMTPVNYRMNMQPKLETSKSAKPITIIPKSGSTMVLGSPEKVEKGMIQLRAPPNVPISASKFAEKLNVQNGRKASSKTVSSKKNSILSTSEICAAALKRQERIIKNRESAYLSRKRKKEYVTKLESELLQIAAENSSLREENSRLKTKILDLEKEISKLKATFSPKTLKKTTCCMVALFMLTFNFAPYSSSIFEKVGKINLKSNQPTQRVGRILLWDDSSGVLVERNDSKALYTKLKDISDEDESPYIVDFDKPLNSSSCQHFINKTESLRLENDLLGWVERVEKKRKQTKMSKHRLHVENPLPHLATWARHRTEPTRDIWARKKNKNEILIYETPRKAYEDFFDAIHRRDDTFYFVSFSGDHLLLPAIAHNKTLRPRMSFVMPAMTLNESVEESDNHISMMQIDCEVMDTKLVHIKESVIPEHLRQKHNSSKPHSRNSAEYSSYRQTRRLQSTKKLPPK